MFYQSRGHETRHIPCEVSRLKNRLKNGIPKVIEGHYNVLFWVKDLSKANPWILMAAKLMQAKEVLSEVAVGVGHPSLVFSMVCL